MPHPRCLLVAALLLVLPLSARAYEPPAVPAPAPLKYPDDTFEFKNETVWNYVGGSVEPDTDNAHVREYTRRCFVLSRAVVQFWKFARFDPTLPPLDADGLAQRIRQVTERSVWLPALAPQDRIVIPGYPNLREASAKMRYVFEANIGRGWPIYFRPGNGVIAMWVTRALEDRLNDEIYHDLQMNTPTILWVYRFPSLKMNHVVVVYSGTHDAAGYHYHVYDPNYRDRFSHLEYDPATRTFAFQKVYFFKGGPVTTRAIYRGLLQ
ncbi:MAG TPA: hypothetical protein VGC39_02865 [Candidatus Methylacidiphilales bacterium]